MLLLVGNKETAAQVVVAQLTLAKLRSRRPRCSSSSSITTNSTSSSNFSNNSINSVANRKLTATIDGKSRASQQQKVNRGATHWLDTQLQQYNHMRTSNHT